MLICGIKVTHDGGVALIDGNRLVFSAEAEKIGIGRRYSSLDDLGTVMRILRAERYDLDDIDRFVIDGWYAPVGKIAPLISISHDGRPLEIPVGPYVDQGASRTPLHKFDFAGIAAGPLLRGYASYAHVSNHIFGAYCTSPFASRNEEALVLAWDGGMLPRLYRIVPKPLKVEFLGPLFPLVGDVFVEFCLHLEPFCCDPSTISDTLMLQFRLEVPGKAMAYAALGVAEPSAFAVFETIIDEHSLETLDATLGRTVAIQSRKSLPGMSSADLIATFQAYIGKLLVSGLARVLRRKFRGEYPRLCMSGGCALNIKWNSQVRNSGMFREVWIPPFPNDSGAAIGTACCEMVREGLGLLLQWDVYSGPHLDVARVPQNWNARPFNEYELAALLHEKQEPVVVLHGRAELGPRALGNRSILAPAVDANMKHRLNDIKGRAHYRPVAPLCLESRAREVFDPGASDPYMLFEHRLRAGWADRVPAIVHLDGSARLQTIAPSKANTVAGRILQEYERISGIPVLCNTSANFPGHGFFQDANAATDWGRTQYVWANGVLYTNPHRPIFSHT